MAGVCRLGDHAKAPLDVHGCPACPHPNVEGPAGRRSDTAAIDRELIARGVPAELSTPFAGDLIAPHWQGGVSLVHCPKGQPASEQSSLVLLSGARSWLADARRSDGAVLGEASRERFGDAVKGMLRSLDSTTRKLDRAGELDS